MVGPAGGLGQLLLSGIDESSQRGCGLVPNQVYSILELKEIPAWMPSSNSHASASHPHAFVHGLGQRAGSALSGGGHGHAATPAQRLVRLHCPWPMGQWEGAWSRGSPEWAAPAVTAHQDHFGPTLADEATFWMPFDQLVARFNRLHVCR